MQKDTICGLSKEEHFASGHKACAGCGAALVPRYALKAAGKNTIVCNATGCLEVFSTAYPETAWKVPWIHVTFENAASVASGIDKALTKQGKRDKLNLLVFGGDGGTFDIGFQFLSGAIERGHKFTYICYDNEAYMNTGIQRSGSTPKYAATTTSPAGKKIHGKTEFKKPMPFIIGAHKNVYVATANIAFPQDFVAKVKKALAYDGPSYIQVYAPCPTGWKFASDMTIEISKMAFNTNIYPLFEIEDGVITLNREPSNKRPVEDFFKMQGRLKHLNDKEIRDVQKHVDKEFERIKHLSAMKITVF